MDATNELRRVARDRRDKLIAKAHAEYQSTLGRIAEVEQDLLGVHGSAHKSLAACVSAILPKDDPFTVPDVVRSLEVSYPARPWPRRSVSAAITKLRSRGLVRRLSKARNRFPNVSQPATYVRASVKVKEPPFADMPLSDVLCQVLAGKSMNPVELALAVLAAGYITAMPPKCLRDHIRNVLRKDGRFQRVGGDRWTC